MLAGIFVDSDVRSMGIGKKLLDYIKSIYPAFSLHVYQKNERAVALPPAHCCERRSYGFYLLMPELNGIMQENFNGRNRI